LKYLDQESFPCQDQAIQIAECVHLESIHAYRYIPIPQDLLTGNNQINIHHFDCYRLRDPEELEYIGMREYFLDGHIQLFEWPDLGREMIPDPDISISLSGNDDKRKICIAAHTEIGEKISQCVTS
jgi:hypothetical protein